MTYQTNPVDAEGTIRIFAGVDYYTAANNACRFFNTAGTWPDLTGSTCKVYDADTGVDLAGTVTVVVPTGVTQEVKWEIANTLFTAAMKGECRYKLQAALNTTPVKKVILAQGTLIKK